VLFISITLFIIYINGQNLNDFLDDIKKYKIIVTYNIKTFDVPFIETVEANRERSIYQL